MHQNGHMAIAHAHRWHDMSFGLALFAICLAGIMSQPYLGLSFFWLANAFMLGMLVRFPQLNRLSVWLICAVAFFLSDVVSGNSLVRNLALNGGNLASVGVACLLLRPLSRQEHVLKGQEPTLYVLRAILVASLVAGVFGIFVNPLLFGGTSREGFLFWAATEMVNYVTFLPILLTLPHRAEWTIAAVSQRLVRIRAQDTLPLFALIFSLAGAILIGGGPGTALFPIPALLWCALAYNLFLTAWISLLFSLWTLFALRMGLMWSPTDLAVRADLITMRLGVSLVAFTPLVVGSIVSARNDLLDALRRLADYDAMTGLRNRRSFLEVGGDALARSLDKAQTVTLLMLDIDHFKSINDGYGHKAGDQVLAAFAAVLKNLVRTQDIVGRLGGEEFGIVMPDCGIANAARVAERINQALRAKAVVIEGGRSIPVTVSIGVHVEREDHALETSLGLADEALYRAKNSGRDKFEFSSKIPLALTKAK